MNTEKDEDLNAAGLPSASEDSLKDKLDRKKDETAEEKRERKDEERGAPLDPRKDSPLASADERGVGRNAAADLEHEDKGHVIKHDFKAVTSVSWRFILIAAALAIAFFLLRFVWVGLLPVLLALLLTTVLFPVAAKLRTWKFPPALASATVLVGSFAIIIGIFSAIAPTVRDQSKQLASQAQSGINEVVKLIQDSGLNVDAERVQTVINDVTEWVKGQASNIATGVMSGLNIASSIALALAITLVVTFFMLKDGDTFLPWMRKYTGPSVGWHATELFSRIWKTLAGFIQAQAIVSFVDAVLIGAGLLILGVPLAFVLAIITFFAGFIPIVGAISAGVLSVIIALVSNGLTNALLVLALILIVQQIEGNVLSPLLQSKAMGLHAAIVLLSVTVGSTLAGIVGAFLAVPVAATIAVVLRYHAETVSVRSGEIRPDELELATSGSDEPDSPRTQVKLVFEDLYRSHQRSVSRRATHGAF